MTETYLIPVPGLTVQTTWSVAGVKLHNSASATDLITRHLTLLPTVLRQFTTPEAVTLPQVACAEVIGDSLEHCLDQIQDTVDLLRVFTQTLGQVEMPYFGLPGEVDSDRLRFLRLDGHYGVGWQHTGSHMGLALGDHLLDAWTSSDHKRLADRVANKDPRNGTRRLITAVRLLSRAFIEPRPTVRTLNVVAAAESLLGGDAKTFQLARRAMYFTCGPDGDRCGRERPACLVLTTKPETGVKVLTRLDSDTTAGAPYCSEWTHFLDRYSDRSDVAHGKPSASVTDQDATRDLYWAAKRLLPATMGWWLDRPHSDGQDIDAAIDAIEAPGSP